MSEDQARRDQLNDILSILNEELDISDAKYQEAEDRYTAVGKWLERPDSLVRDYSPQIYVQGSFLLGTAIKPVGEDGEYDIDSVCTLELTTAECSQEELKQLIGSEMKEYARAQGMKKPVEEGRRCWTLNYADESHFHLDVLPAIPNAGAFRHLLETGRASSDWTDDAIGITDNTLPDYTARNADWPVSNPKGYADWFRTQMQDALSSIYRQEVVLLEEYTSVDDVPSFRFRTPLQRAAQMLKYHRDTMYGDDEDKPVSVIITTLAAHAYNNEDNVVDALQSIVHGMLDFIKVRNGVRWVANPVNPLENFADKWVEHPEREKKFYEWHDAITTCIQGIVDVPAGLDSLNKGLAQIAGSDVARRVMTSYGATAHETRDRGDLKAAKGTATLGSIGTTVQKHTFYGR